MSRGGAERVISILSDYFVSVGYSVSVMVLFKGELGYVLNSEVSFVDASSEGGNLIKFFKSVLKSRKEIKRIRPDIVFSFLDSISLIEGFAFMGLGIKGTDGKRKKPALVCCERIDPSSTKRSRLFRHLINRIYSHSAKTVVQTKRAFDFFPEAVRKNAVIIPNPVSVSCFAAEYGQRRKRFVTAGRLTAQKNHKLLIDSFADLHEIHSDWVLDIYGEGELREDLERQISGLHLEDAVFLRGNSADVHKEMADATCFVLSSDYEGFSNALLEGMMMGLCPVSTDVAGSDEVIKNGENGYVVPVGDKEALFKAMMKVAEDEENTRKMSDSAKKAANYYLRDNITGLWQRLADELETRL